MLELALAFSAIAIMSRIAVADNESGLVWGGVTFALCLGSLLIPLPALRILLAMVAAFVLMFVVKIVRER